MPTLFNQAMQYYEIVIFIVTFLVLMVLIILCFILMAAFLTLYERQTLAAIQRRKGPNVVGFMGLLQAFADAFKLLFNLNANSPQQ